MQFADAMKAFNGLVNMERWLDKFIYKSINTSQNLMACNQCSTLVLEQSTISSMVRPTNTCKFESLFARTYIDRPF